MGRPPVGLFLYLQGQCWGLLLAAVSRQGPERRKPIQALDSNPELITGQVLDG